jgi:hypothetical protein
MQAATVVIPGGGGDDDEIHLPCDTLQIVFAFLLDSDEAQTHDSCTARLVCREWNDAYMRIPKAGLSYDSIDSETDARFRLRLTDHQLRRFDGIRNLRKKQRFRSVWFFDMTREPRKSASNPRVGPRAPFEMDQRKWIEEEFELLIKDSTRHEAWLAEEYACQAHTLRKSRLAGLEETLRKHAMRRADAARKEVAKNAARKYWAQHRVDLELRYGVAFAIVFQWKKLVCQRMSRGYHNDIKVPGVLFKRCQWEACAAASLKTCVFRAFDTIRPEGEENIESILERHYQQRLTDRTMLSSILESHHSFHMDQWNAQAYEHLEQASATLRTIRQETRCFAQRDDILICGSNCFYLARTFYETLASAMSIRSNSDRVKKKFLCVSRRYKQDPDVCHLIGSIAHVQHLLESNSQCMISLEPKVDAILLDAFHSACPTKESLYTRAGDGSDVIRITTVYAVVNHLGADEADLLPRDKRIALGKCVRKYIDDHQIPNASTKVSLTTLSPNGKSSTFDTYAYREEHILVLIKACIQFKQS